MGITKIKWESSNRPVWLAQRQFLQGSNSYDECRFGSSDFSTILGYNKWSSRKKLFWNMLGRYKTEFNSYKMEMGLRYETANKDSFESFMINDKEGFDDRFCSGEKLRKLQSPKFFLMNSEYGHSFSSLDFIMPPKSLCPFTGEITDKPRPVETKFVNYNSYAAWKGEPPMYYKVQVIHQMMLLGSDVGYLSVIAGGDFYDCFMIQRDEQLVEEIYNAGNDFKNRILQAKAVLKIQDEEKQKSAPDYDFIEQLEAMIVNLEPEATAADLEFIENEMFPETNTLEMQGDLDDEQNIELYLEANQTIKIATDVKALARVKLVENMKDFEILKVGDHKVTNRRNFEKKTYFSVK